MLESCHSPAHARGWRDWWPWADNAEFLPQPRQQASCRFLLPRNWAKWIAPTFAGL